MKYYYYKIINDICNSISEAVNYMISTDSDMLLENCLESLSSVRKILNQNKESLENDDIFLILDSIESQFKIFSEITIYDKLICDIDRLKEECINGIKYKIRVLFVAELGGKWDAMASVYEALKKRDDCIVDVVLQPVFRSITLPDGNNKMDVVYNDWLTEKGINHISYEQYDLAEMQPDITFTSQPYDSCAIPKFWAKNIAKYSRLVYLPYFAAVTFNEISTAFNSFFKLTTQKYSWRIACQSERMKNYYEQYGSRKGENVIASGLPKWDYPLKLDATNTPMPEEWKRKLAGKTVFLWNTHFSTELCGSMILTKKVFEFLEIFQNNPDIALIWRPHPMMDTVIKVYHSESEIKFYKSLKEYVRNSDNMVIDEGGPYDAAFLYSDALISDFSTLLDQYLFMDKPVLMLTKNDISEELDRLCDDSNLSDYSKLRFANTIEMQKDFINDVLNGDMSWKANQDYILNNFFYNPNADCGQRFADQLIEEFKEEVLLPPRKTEVLIIGSIKDSIPCLKSLSELNYDYHICDMLLCKDDNIQSSFNINEITQFEYKCIVITQKKPNEVAFIKDILINDYNIDNNKIVEFWHIYNACIPTMVVDRVMSNPKHDEYDGMILGLSHTETGIITDRLSGAFCNLSVSSQDLYYQLETLKYCINKYPQKISNLKYAIIDLYDYHYFNYDNSLSKSAINYLLYGGINTSPHHFNDNKNVEYTHEQIVASLLQQKFQNVTNEHIKLWNKYFINAFQYTDFEGLEPNYKLNERFKIVSNEEIQKYEYSRVTVTKKFDDTISENIDIFTELIHTFKSINPDIRIYTVVIPKYIETEKNDEKYLSMHKKYFNELVSQLQESYNFIHLDLKEMSDISYHRNYYYDAAHLNYYGAMAATDFINKIIFGDSLL